MHVLHTTLCRYLLVACCSVCFSSLQDFLCNPPFGLLQQRHHGGASVCGTVSLQDDLWARRNLGIPRIRSLFSDNGTVVNQAIGRQGSHNLEALFPRIQGLRVGFIYGNKTLTDLEQRIQNQPVWCARGEGKGVVSYMNRKEVEKKTNEVLFWGGGGGEREGGR